MTSSETKILVAEDNPVNQMVIVGMLKACGHVADVAKNGSEALDLFQKNQYNLILMDCEMPVMDGYEATIQIRNIEKMEPTRKRVPIAALTAHALHDVEQKCLEVGMDKFVTKPLKLEVVKNLLATLLKNQ